MLPRLHWGEIGEITPSKILFGARNWGNCLRSVCFLRLKRIAKGLFFQFIKCQWSFIFDLITAKGNPSQVVFKLLPTSEIQVTRALLKWKVSVATYHAFLSSTKRKRSSSWEDWVLHLKITCEGLNIWQIKKIEWMNEWKGLHGARARAGGWLSCFVTIHSYHQ